MTPLLRVAAALAGVAAVVVVAWALGTAPPPQSGEATAGPTPIATTVPGASSTLGAPAATSSAGPTGVAVVPTASPEPIATDAVKTPRPPATQAPARPTPTPGDGPWWLGGVSRQCGTGAAPYGCAGELAAGTHTSAGFVPALTYDVIPGWVNISDWPDRFVLIPDTAENREALARGDDPLVSITILRLKQADSTCTDSRPPTAFTTLEIAAWLGGHQEEIAVQAPLTVGGLPGHRVDLEVRPRLGALCIGDPPELRPVVTDRYRVIVLAMPDGGRIGIQIKVPSFGRFDMFIGESAPIIESFQFDVGS